MTKKSICILLGAAFVLTLGGCTTNDNSSSSSFEQTSQDSSSEGNNSSDSIPSSEKSSLPDSSIGGSSREESEAESSSNEELSSEAASSEQTSSEESASSESTIESSSASSDSAPSFTRSQNEVKTDILATKIKGYSFEETSDLNGVVTGTVAFASNSYQLSGTQTLLGKESEIFKYVGYSDNEYYNIENTRTATYAKKKEIANEVNNEDKTIKITLADASSDVVSASSNNKTLYGEDWFSVDALPLFGEEENNTFKVSAIDASSYKVTMSGTKEGVSRSIELLFNENHELTYGKLIATETVSSGDEGWGDDDLYASTSSVSVTTKEATFLLGEKASAPLIDTSAYFITDITDFSVSSYMDVKENNGKALVGETIKAPRIDAFTPSTALNAADFEIVSSSNTDVIAYESFCYKALKAGTSILTISDARRSVIKTIEMTVEVPPLSLITIHLPARSLKVGEAMNGTITCSPSESNEEIEAVSLNEEVATVTLVDRENITINGIKAGKAIIEVHSKKNPTVKTNVEITVEESAADASWVVGEWNATARTYTVKLVFNSDKTGSATQTFIDEGTTNTATFSWDLDTSGNLVFSSWSTGTNQDFQQPSSVKSDASTLSIAISFKYLDWTDTGDDYSYRNAYNVSLTKKAEAADELWPANNYFGTTNKDFTVTLNLNADHTATFICENKTYQINWSTEAVKSNANMIRFHFSFITTPTNGEAFIDSAVIDEGCYGTINHMRGKYGMISIGYKSNSLGTNRFTLFIQK